MKLELIGQLIALGGFLWISFYILYNIRLQDKKYGTFGSPKK